MKKTYLLLLLLLLPYCIQAQQDKQAHEVLDKTSIAFRQAGGIRATFNGSQEGTLLLKGEKFYLNSNGIQTWFDGQTQWSYVESTDEVNISTPTPEELQGINPYALLSLYKNGYNCRYKGNQRYKGKQGHEVVLTPQQPTEISAITFLVSADYQPIYIKIVQTNQTISEIMVTSYQTHQPLDDGMFRFDPKKYPHAEIIDLR